MPEERHRFVYKEWVRDPKGKLLEKPPPQGKRPENNIIWGHTIDEFYWIPRIPGVNVLTIWSRSMIQDYGENYLKEKHDEEPEPRRLRPWPCLTLPEHIQSASELGYVDEGCGQNHEHPLRRVQDEVAVTRKVAAGSKAKAKRVTRAQLPANSEANATAGSQVDATVVPVNPTSGTPPTASGNVAPPPAPIAPGVVGAAVPAPIIDAPASDITPGQPVLVPSAVPPPPQDPAPRADAAALAPTADVAPMDVDVDAAAAVPVPASAPTPAVSPTGSPSWASDRAEWAAAMGAVPLDADAEPALEVSAAPNEADAGNVPATLVQSLDADAMDEDAPKGEGNGDVPLGAREGVDAAADAMSTNKDVMDTREVEDGVGERDKPDVGGMDVDGAVKENEKGPDGEGMAADAAGADPMDADTPKVEDGAVAGDKLNVGGMDVEVSEPRGDIASDHVLVGAEADPGGADPKVASEVDVKAGTGDETVASVPSTTEAADAKTTPVDDNTIEFTGADVTAVTDAPPPRQSPPPPPPTPVPPIFHDLPKLEEFIPEEYFPDILYVNDPDKSTALSGYYSIPKPPTTQSEERVPRKYKRVWPRFARDTEPATAFNTDVDCASIKLPTPPAASVFAQPPGSPLVVPGPETNLRVAHLNLSSAPRLGVGNHSAVHRAALRLPRPLGARSPTGEVTVAAKTGFSNSEARQLLLNEGRIYGAFPKQLMEDWCGLNLVAPITHPVPVHAVVPKFYGYYVPVREDVERDKREAIRVWKETQREKRKKAAAALRENRALKKAAKAEKRKQAEAEGGSGDVANDDGVPVAPQGEVDGTSTAAAGAATKIEKLDAEADEDEGSSEEGSGDDTADHDKEDEAAGLLHFMRSTSYKDWQRMSPILLLEECGSPIMPAKFTDDARSECYSLALRLHYAEFTQGSFYIRNILMQPGPLTVAPSARSARTPSFRIIDFGRGEHWQYNLAAAQAENAERRQKSRSRAQMRAGMQVPTEAEMKQRMEDEKQEDLADKKALELVGKSWWESRDYEVRKAHSELQIRDFNY